MLKQPPVRICCMQRHSGPVCPDGKVMCALCFKRFDPDDLNTVDGLKEDVCNECAEAEKKVMDAQTDGSPGGGSSSPG